MQPTNKREKGIAMVIALMLLLVMSVMVAGFMLTITNEQKMGGNQVRYVEALNLAEAGVSEVAARLNLPSNDANAIAENTPQNADWEARILNETNLPAAAGNTQYFPALLAGTTNQLSYTVSDVNGTDAQYVLTARYKTNAAGNAIFYYDYSTGTQTEVAGPPFNAPNKNSFPIWVIRSTGMVGNVRRSVEAEVTKNKIEANITAAVACDANFWGTGAVVACGHNHFASTPSSAIAGGGSPNSRCIPYEICSRTTATCTDASCLCGVSTTTGHNIIDPSGGGPGTGISGEPRKDLNGPFKELWEVLGFATEQEMRDAYSITAIANKADVANTYSANGYGGFYEYTGDQFGVSGDELGASDLPDSCGGILWIKGPFDTRAQKIFKGIIYVEGGVMASNGFFLLGAFFSKGDTLLNDMPASSTKRGFHFTGNADFLYSSEVVQNTMQQISSSSMGLRQISWREVDIQD